MLSCSGVVCRVPTSAWVFLFNLLVLDTVAPESVWQYQIPVEIFPYLLSFGGLQTNCEDAAGGVKGWVQFVCDR